MGWVEPLTVDCSIYMPSSLVVGIGRRQKTRQQAFQQQDGFHSDYFHFVLCNISLCIYCKLHHRRYFLFETFFLNPVHMRWFTHGVQIIHICIICTRVYFWPCERNCIYVKVNLHMCKYTPPCKYTPALTRCIFAFAYMYFLHVCIFGHVNAQQIYTRMQM